MASVTGSAAPLPAMPTSAGDAVTMPDAAVTAVTLLHDYPVCSCDHCISASLFCFAHVAATAQLEGNGPGGWKCMWGTRLALQATIYKRPVES